MASASAAGLAKRHSSHSLLCSSKRGTIQCLSAASESSGRGPIPGILEKPLAGVAELADAQDLGSCGRKAVGVQIPPSAPAFLIGLSKLPASFVGSTIHFIPREIAAGQRYEA